MAHKQSKQSGATPPKSPEAPTQSERPTVTPPFDVEAFARATTTPTGKPRPNAESARHGKLAPPPAPPQEADTERITLTNELELEKARVKSAGPNAPHSPSAPSLLSLANARAPSVPSMSGTGASAPPPRSLSPSSIEAAVLGALDGSSPPEITERTIDDPIAEMRERFALGDYSGALEMSELILADTPDNAEALDCGDNCRTVLENMYTARLGPLDRVPMVIVPRAQMRWLSMDHRAGFVLSLIDGTSSLETILDMSGMPKLDAYRILQELVQQKIISFR